MGGETGKKGEVKQKSKGKMLEEGPEGSKSLSSLSFSNERKHQHHRQHSEKPTVTEAVCEERKQENHSTQFQNIINSSTVWNELVQEKRENCADTMLAGDDDAATGVMGTTTEKQLISPCGFSPTTDTGINTISGIQENANHKLSFSSGPSQKGNSQRTSLTRGDTGRDHDTKIISSTTNNFLATAEEDYDQSFVSHLSSDENEHLLPPRTRNEENGNDNGVEQRGKRNDTTRKKGDGKRSLSNIKRGGGSKRKKDDNINKTTTAAATTTGSDVDEDTEVGPKKRPTSLTIPFPLIRDGKNGNFYNKREGLSSTSSSSSPPPPNSSSSSFYTFCLSGISKVLIMLSIFSLLLVTWLWFHTRLSYLEREIALQKERMEILADNVLEAERLLNRQTDFDPEEDENDDDFGEMHRRIVINEANIAEEESSRQKQQSHDGNHSTGHRPKNTMGKSHRVKRRVDHRQNQQPSSSNRNVDLANYNVEFLNTKLPRDDKDKSGSGGISYDKTAGSASETDSSVPDDEWVWLTSYSRIPVPAIEAFCSATKTYCPVIEGPSGPPGNPGRHGEKGEKGDPGLPGVQGHKGHPGPPGHPGLRGPKGEPGIPGLPGADGRDGLPGEPGLDGIPGRNGLDGVPGIDGIPGMDGRPGIPGRNGSDGIPGSLGPQGSSGPQGPRGLPGPRGPSGTAGTPGRDGIPGVQAWAVGNNTKQLLIPPSILGSDQTVKPLTFLEGENVRLRCSASGVPRPVIKWKKKEGGIIPLGSWKNSAVDGPVLNLTRINREHMGEYVCIADNGVTPHKQMSFNVEVHFPPMIRIPNQMIGASISSKAILDCYIEAFPPSVTYWERSDGRVLETGEKYQVGTKELGPYKVHMMLNVSRVSMSDMGRYHCVSKNELGITKGDFTLYEVDPNLVTPPPGSGKVKVYGQEQPEHVDLDDLCPLAPPCPDCPPRIETGRCRSGGFALLDMVGWEILPLGNLTNPKPTNRTQDCVLSAVGKPVFNRYSVAAAGCWMREPVQSGISGEKYWVTRMEDTNHLYEFSNRTAFAKGHPTRNFTLPFPFKGNFHAVFNGSFFYVTESKEGNPKIVRLDLFTGKTMGDLELPYASFSAEKLYSSEFSWVDLNVDENGLWAVHSLMGSNNTAIVKIHADLEGMDILYGWNVTISHVYAGDMFVICGVLYAVDSTTERETKIRLALDLYRRTLLRVDLSFSNPFRHTSMVSYNPRTRELFTWDKGNQLIYPIKYTDAGYDIKDDNKERGNNDIYGGPFSGYPSSA